MLSASETIKSSFPDEAAEPQFRQFDIGVRSERPAEGFAMKDEAGTTAFRLPGNFWEILTSDPELKLQVERGDREPCSAGDKGEN